MTKTFHSKYFEFTPEFGFSLTFNQFNEESSCIQIHLIWGNIYINLPPIFKNIDETFRVGIGLHERDSIFLFYGKNYKLFFLPWYWKHYHTTYWDSDNNIVSTKDVENLYGNKRHKLLKSKTYDYTYVLKNGVKQKCLATIYVMQIEWIWKISKLLKLKYPRKLLKTISVTFSNEIGEETGTWKGGCIQCGYIMLPNETPLDTLRRMERERKF